MASRVSSWWFDSNRPNPILTAGTFTASITMSAAHSLHTATVTQYQVSISGTYHIFSMTPTTIGGDNYWYDSGSSMSVVLNGTFSRSCRRREQDDRVFDKWRSDELRF